MWDIAEFFVMKKYKRCGVGTRAALKVWAHFKGWWQVRVLVSNTLACSFWLQAIEKFISSTPSKTEAIMKGEKWIVYRFESRETP